MNQMIPRQKPQPPQKRGVAPRPPQGGKNPKATALARALPWVLATTILLLIISLSLLVVALIVDGETDPDPIQPVGNSSQKEEPNTPTGSNGALYPTVPTRSDYTIENAASYQTITELQSQYTILLDLDSYEAVAGLNADQRICPASMTKVMTLLVACEQVTSLTERVTVSAEAVTYQRDHGASGLAWKGGETLSVEDLLYLIYFRSDTVACLTVAEHLAGGEAAFVKLMNERAEALGLKNTHFTNTTGLDLDGEEYYTTCRDMATIMAYALDNPLASKIMNQTGSWYLPDGSPAETIRPTWVTDRFGGNAKLDTVTIRAAKTGWESEPGACLVSYAVSESGKRYINVIVGGGGLSATASTADVKRIYRTYAD